MKTTELILTMSPPDYIFKIIDMAKEGHKDQLYGDKDYFRHHITKVVAETLLILKYRGITESHPDFWVHVAVSYAHDLIEDTDISAEDLRETGLPERGVQGIIHITKEEDETLSVYLRKVCENGFSRLSKYADSSCNLRFSIRDGVNKRIIKYTKVLGKLAEYDAKLISK